MAKWMMGFDNDGMNEKKFFFMYIEQPRKINGQENLLFPILLTSTELCTVHNT